MTGFNPAKLQRKPKIFFSESKRFSPKTGKNPGVDHHLQEMSGKTSCCPPMTMGPWAKSQGGWVFFLKSFYMARPAGRNEDPKAHRNPGEILATIRVSSRADLGPLCPPLERGVLCNRVSTRGKF